VAKTPEVKVKDKIKALIERVCTERGLHYCIDWHAGSGFTSTLDATGVIAGHPFICEVKRWDEDAPLTGRQKMKVEEFRRAGANVHVIDDPTSLRYLEEWLTMLEPREAFWP
jgi:hypothetical protein